MNKRVFVIISALLAAAVILPACAEQSVTPSGDTVVTEPSVTSAEEETTAKAADHDDLGEFDFGGAEFRMLTPDPSIMNWANPVIDVSEQTGETLNDAIYERSRAIEERFNVKIVEEYGSWDMGASTLQPIVSSGDTTYSIVTMLDRFALASLADGLVKSYAEIPYIDLTKSYWGGSMLEYSSIGGENYFAFGDFSLYAYDNTSALLFNKSLIGDYTLENPYELVNSGKWTLDKFSEMCVTVTGDLDGDSVMTAADRWGYLSMPKQVLPSIWIAGGALSVTKDENDLPVLNLTDEKFVTLFTRAFEVTRDTGVWYENTIQADTDTTLENMFISGLGLFHDSTFNKIMRLREMDADFGIIPYPKADEAQTDYLTRVSGALFSVVPVTEGELEMTGVMLEALASESSRTVIPTYYDVSLKYKYTRDEESLEMLDVIFENRVYDLGDSFWCDSIRDNFIKTMFTENNRDIASAAAKNNKSLTKSIEKTINAITNKD